MLLQLFNFNFCFFLFEVGDQENVDLNQVLPLSNCYHPVRTYTYWRKKKYFVQLAKWLLCYDVNFPFVFIEIEVCKTLIANCEKKFYFEFKKYFSTFSTESTVLSDSQLWTKFSSSLFLSAWLNTLAFLLALRQCLELNIEIKAMCKSENSVIPCSAEIDLNRITTVGNLTEI